MEGLDNSFATYNPFKAVSSLNNDIDRILELDDEYTHPVDSASAGCGEEEVRESETCLERNLNMFQVADTQFTIGNNLGRPLTASIVQHIPIVPAYPSSSSSGHAYIIPITKTRTGGIPDEKEVLKRAKDVRSLAKHVSNT